MTGNGKPTAGVAHANSICVFSGKNDNPSAPTDNPDAGRVELYGQLVRLGVIENFFEATPKTFNPGDSCRAAATNRSSREKMRRPRACGASAYAT